MKQLSGEYIMDAVSTALDAKIYVTVASDRMRELASSYVELQGVCVNLAEALESLEMAFVQTCENWIPKPIDIANIEQVAKARAALARYRGKR